MRVEKEISIKNPFSNCYRPLILLLVFYPIALYLHRRRRPVQRMRKLLAPRNKLLSTQLCIYFNAELSLSLLADLDRVCLLSVIIVLMAVNQIESIKLLITYNSLPS